jgi:hypothetical protein
MTELHPLRTDQLRSPSGLWQSGFICLLQDFVATSGAAPAPGMRGFLDGPAIFSPHIEHWIDTSQVRQMSRCCNANHLHCFASRLHLHLEQPSMHSCIT